MSDTRSAPDAEGAREHARRSWAEKHYTEPCNSCGAGVGKPCRTASGSVTMRHASRRTRVISLIPPASPEDPR